MSLPEASKPIAGDPRDTERKPNNSEKKEKMIVNDGSRLHGKRALGLLSFFSLLAILLSVIATAPSSAQTAAEESPSAVAEARRASSSEDEPSLIVGPAGETLVTDEETTPVGPGIELTSFDRFDARGWVRGDVLKVDLGNGEVSTDLLFPGKVAAAEPLSTTAEREGAVAGVNGDFFDIGNTKAPLGAEIDDGELLKGPFPGWTRTVGVGEDGIGRLAKVMLQGSITFPDGGRELAALNQPNIPRDGIGLYTPLWGSAARNGAVAGASRVREVVVRNGKVFSTGDAVSTGEIPEGSSVLVGREAGAETLAGLKTGDAVEFSYSPKTNSSSLLDFAVGGNLTLLSDGELPVLDDRVSEPRTAAGFSADGRTMYLVTVDGRQRDSRGMTMRELGGLLKGFGADDALNLDGGGSSTLLARDPGEEDAEVENSPSDGLERAVPNGIGVFLKPGTGKLAAFDVETSVEDEHAERAFPGLSRTFMAEGYDENFGPVETAEVSWSALPADVGRFDGGGIFRAAKSGSAVARAQASGKSGTSPLRVLGELDRIEANPGQLGLISGGSEMFSVTGYDAEGYAAPIEPRDVKLEYNSSVVEVTSDGGTFRVTPKIEEGSTLITVSVLGERIFMPVTVGLSTKQVSGFDDPGAWTFSKYPSAVGGGMDFVPGRNGQGLRLTYDFSTTTATRAVYANANPLIELPGQPQRIGMWVNGDGNGAWLRAVVRDAANVNYTLNLAGKVDWIGWRYVEATVPKGVQYPLRFWRTYPVETNRAKQYKGELVFDDLSVKVSLSVEVPAQPVDPDPMILRNASIGGDRWKFAVLADSQFVAKSPDSQQVRLARESLRQIVAAKPDFLVISGDFVDTAYTEDFDLARRILKEEVGDRIPVYYIPGNHEIMGTGNLGNFRAEFENNRYTFDHEGTRFILLDSSTGSFRTADFQQLVDLKGTLETAAKDPAVKNVVLSSHHPTRDPLPTQNSQLGDRKEAGYIEQLLTEFREDSNGKGAAYIGGHAHTVNVERVEGVPYMVVGPAGKAPYGAPDDGGFYAWTMFGVDPTPAPSSSNADRSDWLQAEVLPLLENVSLDAPGSLATGETGQVTATGQQAGGLRFPLRYPATVRWSGSENLFVGSGEEAERAAASGRYAAVLNPITGEIEALKTGPVTIRVESNGVTAETEIQLTQEREVQNAA